MLEGSDATGKKGMGRVTSVASEAETDGHYTRISLAGLAPKMR